MNMQPKGYEQTLRTVGVFFPTLRKVHGILALFLLITSVRAFDVRPQWLYKRAAQ